MIAAAEAIISTIPPGYTEKIRNGLDNFSG
jgi:hypothetical protein